MPEAQNATPNSGSKTRNYMVSGENDTERTIRATEPPVLNPGQTQLSTPVYIPAGRHKSPKPVSEFTQVMGKD